MWQAGACGLGSSKPFRLRDEFNPPQIRLLKFGPGKELNGLAAAARFTFCCFGQTTKTGHQNRPPNRRGRAIQLERKTPMARAIENLGAVGIGVSDIARSEDFYTRVLGMSVQQRIELPHLKEVVVGYEGRTSVVLMHWLDASERNYKANAVKLVFFVPDPKAMIAAIRADGLPIQREAEAMPEFNNMVVGLAEDPDGYVVEFLAAPRSAEA
jgi:lactoylglutathione lyase